MTLSIVGIKKRLINKRLLGYEAVDNNIYIFYITTYFSIIAPKLWNSLPHSIISIVSDHTFKVKLKTHLFNIAYNN